MAKQRHTIAKIPTNDQATHPVKITPSQRLEIIKIGKEAGLRWTYEVIDLLLRRYNGANKC